MNFVPYVIEKTSAGERSYDIYSRLLKERIVFLNGEVNDTVSNRFEVPPFLEAEDPNADINFYINSPVRSCNSPYGNVRYYAITSNRCLLLLWTSGINGSLLFRRC